MSILSSFFGKDKGGDLGREKKKPQGLIGYFGLSDWFKDLSGHEQQLLRSANKQGTGLGKDDLTSGDCSTSQTKSGWLNVMAQNVEREDPDFALKLSQEALGSDKSESNVDAETQIDHYFTHGNLAGEHWQRNNPQKALESAQRQLEWYRDLGNRKLLEEALHGLPKQVVGLDIAINVYREQGKWDSAIKLIKEFQPLVHSEDNFKSELARLEARKIREKGETALERGDKKLAIELFEKALAIDSQAGVKRILTKLKKELEV